MWQAEEGERPWLLSGAEGKDHGWWVESRGKAFRVRMMMMGHPERDRAGDAGRGGARGAEPWRR